MPKAVNGMKICPKKDCIHNGEPQPISNFNKERRRSDGLSNICKDCQRKKNQIFRESNPEYGKQAYQNNKEHHNELTKLWYTDHKGDEEKNKRHQYYLKNLDHIQKKSKDWAEDCAKYDSYAKKIQLYRECRRSEENPDLLEIKCYNHKCENWFAPKNKDIRRYLQSINGKTHGVNELYCCEECKKSCPVFNYKGRQIDFENDRCERKNNMQSELHEMVLQLDNYTCQMCGNSLEEFPDLNLVCHHIKPMATDLMLASDVDNCITLCKECHGKVHALPGCSLVELQKKAREQRESLKKIINNN